MAKHPCIEVIKKASGNTITDAQAKELIDGIVSQADMADNVRFANVEEKIRTMGREMIDNNRLAKAIQKRNSLLTVRISRKIKEFTSRFPTLGEGLQAYMNRSARVDIKGARRSVGAQIDALERTYIGKLADGLERMEVNKVFRDGKLDWEIFQELYHIDDPKVNNPSGSSEALKIAKIVNSIQKEIVPRANRDGAFIRMAENYVMRRRWDPIKIRKAGGMGFKPGSADASFKVFFEQMMPLLDHEKTFGAAKDKAAWMKGAHEGILTGVHGKSKMKMMAEFQGTGALAKKVSQPRIFHFKDAESAYRAFQLFGRGSVAENVISDIKRSAHVIGMLENFGPNPEMTLRRIHRKLMEKARTMPDDARQIKSLRDERIETSFQQLTGELDIPENPTYANITRGLLAHSSLSKLGGIVLSALPDKAFWQSALTFQGIRRIDAIVEQFGMFAPRTAAEKSRLRLMGAALSGWESEIASKFTGINNTGGRLFKLQQGYFKINGMNWWDDIHRGSAAKMMAAHLGENANLKWNKLPDDLRRVLVLYDYTPSQWDAIRKTVFTAENNFKYVTPDRVRNVPDDVIDALIIERGDKVTATNRLRYRDDLEMQLRTYILDQVNDASSYPGNKERRIASAGTRAGTFKGSAVRLLMHLKQFPITVWNRTVMREIMNIRSAGLSLKGVHANLRMLELIASTTILGYLSMTVKDALKGRTPKRMFEDDGTFNWRVFVNSMQRGGGLGIYGDFLFTEYDRSYRSALNVVAGPIYGTASEMVATTSDLFHGKDISRSAEKLALSNTPYINLFYIRPVLDYIILWNIQEMINPGSLRRMEQAVEDRNSQGFFIRPSEVAK